MLRKDEKLVSCRDDDARTPLHNAARCGQVGVVELLLSNGATPDARDDEGNTPLHRVYAHAKVAEVLLSHGVPVDIRDDRGQTPLHRAAYYGCPDVIQVLLDNGADVNARDNSGRTPFTTAINGISTEEHIDKSGTLLKRHGATQ